MWILESLSRLRVKRLFLLLSTMLGAGFLLLATFFYTEALTSPLTYALLALSLYIHQRNAVPAWQAALLLPACYGLAHWLNPRYLPLFAASFTLATGWVLFRGSFRLWKWAAAAALFALSLVITAVWERMDLVAMWIPAGWSPLVYGLVFSFCAGFSYLPYLLEKDRVEEAASSGSWTPRGEPEAMSRETLHLYRVVRIQLDDEPHLQQELEEFCEKTVHTCSQYQHLLNELGRIKLEDLLAQAGALKAKAESVTDATAKRQYEQALGNKEKQCRQYESLQNKAERLRAQILHYLSGLENMRFAYANREFRTAGDGKETLEFFMNMTSADSAYDASEAYQELL